MKKIFIIIILLMNIFTSFNQNNSKTVALLNTGTLINKNGDAIFSFRYLGYNSIPEDYSCLRYPESDRYILRGTGKVITIPPQSSISTITDSQEFFIIQAHTNSVGIIDDQNNILIPFGKYESINHWKDDLFFVRITKQAKDVSYSYNCWGVVNTKDEVVIPFLYAYFYPFSSPLATSRAEEPYYFCLLDDDGEEHLPFHDYKKIIRRPFSVSEGIIVGYMNDMETYDTDGNIIVSRLRKYQWIWPYSDGYAFFQNEKGFWGVLDKAGNEVIPAIYNGISTNYSNKSQPVIVKPHTFTDGLVCILGNTGYGAIDTTGKTVIPFEYSYLSPFTNGFAVAARNKTTSEGWYTPEYGILNTKGEVVVPFEYDYIDTPTGYGHARAEKDGKKGIINVRGEVVMPFIYYNIIPFTDSLFIEISGLSRKGLYERSDPYGYLK